MKPTPRPLYNLRDLLRWLDVARPGAAAYVRARTADSLNGAVAGFDIPQNVGDMREFPKSYEGCGFTVDDLEWLRAEIGDDPSVHVWW